MELTEAIDELYRDFARYSRPARIDYCPHCRGEDDVAALLTTPLRLLGAADLNSYVLHVFGTIGGDADFRYLLLRLLEVLAAGEFDDWTDEVLFRAVCRHAPPEQSVENYLRALWDEALRGYPAVLDAPTLLREICASGRDCTPFLASWDGPSAARRLADLVVHQHRCDALARWMAGPVAPRVLEDAVLVETDPDVLSHLSHAYDLLGFHRASL